MSFYLYTQMITANIELRFCMSVVCRKRSGKMVSWLMMQSWRVYGIGCIAAATWPKMVTSKSTKPPVILVSGNAFWSVVNLCHKVTPAINCRLRNKLMSTIVHTYCAVNQLRSHPIRQSRLLMRPSWIRIYLKIMLCDINLYAC